MIFMCGGKKQEAGSRGTVLEVGLINVNAATACWLYDRLEQFRRTNPAGR